MDKENRGFASMEPARQREIASKGGKTAHAMGRAHQYGAGCEVADAGRKGGVKGGAKRRALKMGLDPAAANAVGHRVMNGEPFADAMAFIARNAAA